ncbi:MAG: sigma-70 family RNA polymerase sigma factor [Anaerolineales bacterium]|nr:sigma-70 family RNA polymerase sigma factor [Anaerolineales bacterium]
MDERTQKKIFDEWLNEHKGILFKIIRAYAFNPHDQEDLFQEISLQVWKSIPDFRNESKPSTWIYRVALYTATVWVRKEKTRPPTQPFAEMEHALSVTDRPRDERSEWLYQQIGELEPVDRSVCLLLLDGFSYKEMAKILGISESNVGVKVHRIKKYLIERAKEVD